MSTTAAPTFARGDRLALALIVAGAVAVAGYTIGHLIQRVGHPGGALDDSYIHFQYARAIAEGHPLRYTPGEPRSSGGTSFIWPLALAAPYALGMRGETILWAAWGFSFAALAAVAWEVRALARRVAGDVAANGAAALVLAFPAFAWFAASGMEVVPFAWLLVRAVRRASEWSEGERTKRRRWELFTLAWILPLVRPEGAVITLAMAATYLFFPLKEDPQASWRRRLKSGFTPALAMAFGAALPTLLLLATTGQATSSTAQVKLLSSDPYLSHRQLLEAVWTNVTLAFTSLLNGGPWSEEFVPKGGVGAAIAGIAAILYLSKRSRSTWRGALILLLALCLLTPCLYVTFLWNRLRYLWPFAPAWLLGLACLARFFGESIASLVKPARREIAANIATIALLAGTAFPFVSRFPVVVEDVADSASGIDRQQVALGRWAHDHLDKSATVAVNDTGAIAYFGDVRTFDIVGLTTPGEARYWVAGSASRFEHYEHLFKESPARLPTHFAVYPAWCDCEALRGAELTERTVTDSTILGGVTMGVWNADYSTLGSGDAPWSLPANARVVDDVDVADLDSEAAHGYALDGTPANVQVLRDSFAGAPEEPDGKRIVDGGRSLRTREHFFVKLGGVDRGIARLEAAAAAVATVSVDGHDVASFAVRPGGWREYGYEVPAPTKRLVSPESRTCVDIRFDHPVVAFHHWFVATLASAAPSQ